jgi:hypothetical protein
MSEPAYIFFAMLAFLAYQRERYLYSGIAAGLSTLFHMGSALLLPIYAIFLIRKRKLFALTAYAFIPLAVLASFATDYLLYGDFWAYFDIQTQYFSNWFGTHRLIAEYPFQVILLSIQPQASPIFSLHGSFAMIMSSFLLFGVATFLLAGKDKNLFIYSLLILLFNSMILHPDVARHLLADWPMLIGLDRILTWHRYVPVAPFLCLIGCVYTILFYQFGL